MIEHVRDLFSGMTILVVEDDYYQATDAQETLELAGAAVVGPFSTASGAISAIERTAPDCAVIDINLGGGPQFELARALKTRGIPMVFVSGYDVAMMPADLQDITHLEKPAERASLIKAIRGVVSSSRAAGKI